MATEIKKKKLDKSDEIALHHGFEFSQIPSAYTKKIPFLLPEEKLSVIQNYKDRDIKPKITEPLMVYYDQPILINKKNPLSPKHKSIGLDIIGIPDSTAEAVIINTSLKILKEEGYEDIFIDINCSGDKTSVAKFLEESNNYCKKNSTDLECKNIFNKKELATTSCDHPSCQIFIENSPRPINFLSEPSRRHFKEVLEYLEEMRTPYRINDTLVSEDNHYSKSIFEIKIKDKTSNREIILARGGRYDEVASKATHKKNFVAVGVSMHFKKIKNEKAYSNKIEKPKIFIIQFGFIAKLKSFEVIEILRRHHLTVSHNLHREKLTDQFIKAKEMRIPYIITIGQKEAMENEVIFKNVRESTHEIIKIDRLSQYLKKIKII